MKRRFWLPAIVGVLVLVFFMVLQAPARLLPYFLDSQQVQLSGVSGTLRKGTATRARVQTPGGYLHLGKLSWTLEPLSLFSLTPTAQLSSVWGGQRGSLELRLVGEALGIRDLDMNLDAGLLKQALPVELSGRLEMLFDELLVTRSSLRRAEGRLVWQGAAWQSPGGARALGSYAATLTSPSQERVFADIVTLSGPVVATGGVELDEQNFTVDLFIESSGRALDPDLARALSLIASPEENGYRLRLDGEVAQGR
ncbi:type II secretion system protein N [Congregibacter sp.]|uniref:type II secretion system protein N n=1 Tax=Congregibacter sp. TaxID=2744308 RepID=UPI003F6B7D12